VEWYQAGGTRFAASDYNYPAADGAAASSSAAYGSFEDEAPLLEGAAACSSLCVAACCIDSVSKLAARARFARRARPQPVGR